MAKSGVLTVKVVGDSSNFEKTMGKVSGSVQKIGKAVALGVAAAGAGAVALGNEVLTTGAKLEAWREKTSTVFEGSAGDIRQWADENNETFGVTDDQLSGLAASFGDLLKPMGFTADQAADMSMDVVGLSGALSEWSGGQRTAAEVSEILAKAMLGERDSLKELGISIMEADVQQRLLEKGQKDLTGAALQQAKAIATQELIMEKSVDAQKAYAEGGNSALRASNRLRAGIAELREQMADKLLPIALKVADWLGQHLPTAIAAVRPALDQVGAAFAMIGQFIAGQVWPMLQNIGRWMVDNQPVLIGVATAIGVGLVAAFTSWAIAAGAAAVATLGAIAPVVAVGAAIAGLVAALVWAYENWEGFRNVVDAVSKFLTGTVWPAIQAFAAHIVAAFGDLVNWTRTHWESISQAITTIVNRIKDFMQMVLGAIAALWRAWGDDLLNAAKTMWDFIRSSIENAVKLVQSVIQTALAVINGDWGRAWDGIKGITSAVWDQIKNIVSTAIDLVKSVLGGGMSTVQEVWRGAWDAIKGALSAAWDGIRSGVADGISSVISFFGNLPSQIVSALGNLGSILLGKGRELVQGFINGVQSMASRAASAVANAIPGGGVVRNALGAIPGFHTGGTFQTTRPGGAGLALLRDGERVTTPTEPVAGGGYMRMHPDDIRQLGKVMVQIARAS